MKLTIENWSQRNIKTEVKDFSHIEKVELAVFCSENVIGIFEPKYPKDNRPRLAIEAAKEFIKNPTDENKQRCKADADAAYAAAYAAANAADAAYAAYAAAYAAYAAANAADAADAANAAAYAAYANRKEFRREVISFIASIKNRVSISFSEIKKTIYTHELMVRGGVNVAEQYEPVVKVFSGEKFSVFKNENGKEYVRKNSKVKFRLIDPRTDEEKLVDDISKIIESRPSIKECAVDIVNKYDIKLK